MYRFFRWSVGILLVALGVWAVFVASHFMHPPVGTYIAILGVAAAIMTWRPSAGRSEKVFWIAVIFAFGFMEISNLYYDRAQHDKTEHEARENEAKAFKGIADGISKSIANSQTQFAATMGQINNTLQASENAAENTQPIANIRVTQYSPTDLDPSKGLIAAVGLKFRVDIYLVNAGTATATNLKSAAKLYVAKPDNKDAQGDIAKRFDEQWARSAIAKPTVAPGEQMFSTFSSDAFDEEQASSLNSGAATIYILARFVWSDPTGRWASDQCLGYQNVTQNLIVTHYCQTHITQRYPLKSVRSNVTR